MTFDGGESADALLVGFTLTGGTGYKATSSSTYSCGGSGADTCTDYVTTYCGGGVYVSGSSPPLFDLAIIGNELAGPGTTTSGTSTYYTSSFGGALCMQNGSPILRGVRMFNNYAGSGGGVYVDEDSAAELHQVSIVNNSASEGGGVAVDTGSLSVTNALVAWNAGAGDGGGIYVADGDANLVNVTLGGNDAPSAAGLGGTGTARVLLMNSIVYGSTSGFGINFETTAGFGGMYNDVYGNESGEYNGVDDVTGTSGNLSSEPKFLDFTDNDNAFDDDWHLSTSSPAVDAGNPASEFNDVDSSANDMGAFGGPAGNWAP